MARRSSTKPDKTEALMSKKSSAALATDEARPAAEGSQPRARAARAAKAPREGRAAAAEEAVARAPESEEEVEADEESAPASAIDPTADKGELVVLEEEFEFEDAAAEVEEGDEVVAPVKKKVASEEGG